MRICGIIGRSALALVLVCIAMLAWLSSPTSATADERKLLKLATAQISLDRGCVALLTQPDIFGGTYGFGVPGADTRSRLLNVMYNEVTSRRVKLVAGSGYDETWAAVVPFLYGRHCRFTQVLETPRIRGKFAFINFRRSFDDDRLPTWSGSYAMYRFEDAWRIVDSHGEPNVPVY